MHLLVKRCSRRRIEKPDRLSPVRLVCPNEQRIRLEQTDLNSPVHHRPHRLGIGLKFQLMALHNVTVKGFKTDGALGSVSL